MPITAIADLRFSAADLDAGLAALTAILPDTRGFDGCLSVDVVQDQVDPTHVLLIETWTTVDAHRAYMAWRASSGTSAGFRAALAGPPTMTYFDQRTDI
jgi:quinol monooxygenase YgiN